MFDISDIPSLPAQDQRMAEILVDCYGQAEELTAFEVYLSEALQFPFSATWRDPDQAGHTEAVQVLGVESLDERRGILLNVAGRTKKRRVVADQLWALDVASANAIVLDDYRYWVDQMDGLTPGYDA